MPIWHTYSTSNSNNQIKETALKILHLLCFMFFFLKRRQTSLLIKENETKAQSTRELYKEQKVKTNNQTK